ncbi:MAG: DoxX family membrane protein [Gemmatimonadales bacterium]
MMQSGAAAEAARSPSYGNFQLTALVALRMLIGWHFFYEGLAKLLNPYWTSAGYLSESKWWFSDLFISLAASPGALSVVDFLNSWGVMAIGAGLLLGCLTQAATIAGIVALFLYYIAAPPFVGYTYAMPAEGAYLVVNKVLIELAALVVLLVFPTGKIVGLDRLIFWKRIAGGESREVLTAAEGV